MTYMGEIHRNVMVSSVNIEITRFAIKNISQHLITRNCSDYNMSTYRAFELPRGSVLYMSM